MGSERGAKKKHFSPSVLKVLSQCPHILLVEVSFTEGKALGCEKGNVLGFGLCYEQRREVLPGLYCL
jgi:hypothetical protein